MPKESLCVKVPKIHGEKAIILANKLEIVKKELEIQRNKNFLYIPLIRQPSKSELETLKEQVLDCEILTYTFPERKKRVKTFVELLEDKLSPHLLVSLPRAIDLVGDIAIIEIPPELDAYKRIIGEAILETHKHVRTVLAKAGAILAYSLNGVDRLQGGVANLTAGGIEKVHSLFAIQLSLFDQALSQNYIDQGQYDMVRDYISDPFQSMRSFLVAHPEFLEKAQAADEKTQARARKLIGDDLYRLKS